MSYASVLQRYATDPSATKVRDPQTGVTKCVKDIFTAAVEGDVECILANLDLGVDVNALGQPRQIWGPRYEKAGLFNATALHFACGYNRELAVKALLQRGARTDLRSGSGLTCKEYARRRNYLNVLMLLERGADAGEQDDGEEGYAGEEEEQM